MKATINARGLLTVSAETPLERLALAMWVEKLTVKLEPIPSGLLLEWFDDEHSQDQTEGQSKGGNSNG